MNKNFLLNYVAVAVMLVSTMAQTNASIVIVDTASGTPGMVNAIASDDFFLFHRFEILSTTTLSSVGEHFQNKSAGSAEALPIEPDYFEANYNVAIALQAIVRRAEALKRFEIAFKFRPDNGGPLRHCLDQGNAFMLDALAAAHMLRQDNLRRR